MAQLCTELDDEQLPCAYLHGDLEIGFVPRSESAEAAAYADETVRAPSSAGSAYDAAEKQDNETAEKDSETAQAQDDNRETATPESQVRMTTRRRAETERKKKILEAKQIVSASIKRNKQEIYEEMCAKDPLIRIFGSYDKWYHNEMRAMKAKTIADFKRNRPHSEYATVIDENFKQGAEMTEAEKEQMFKPDTVEEEEAKRKAAQKATEKAAQIAERAAEAGKARGLLYVSREERMRQAGVNIPDVQPQTPAGTVPVQMFGNRGNVSINIGSPLSPGGSFYETAHSPSRFRETANVSETASPKLGESAERKSDENESELNTAILHESEDMQFDDSDKDSHYSPTKDEEAMDTGNDSVMDENNSEDQENDDSDCMVISPPPKKTGAKVKTTQKVKPVAVKEEEEEGRRKRRASSNMENLKTKIKAEKVIYQKKIKKEREEERKSQRKKKKGGRAGKLLSLLKGLITDEGSSDEDDEPPQVSDEALIDLCTNKETDVINWERFYQEKQRMQAARRKTGYKKQKRKRSSDDEVQIVDTDDETARPKKKREKPARKPYRTAKKPTKTAEKTGEDDKTASEEILDLSDEEKAAEKKRKERLLHMTKLKHQCPTCLKKFRSPSELKEHQKQHNDPDGHPWKCGCGKGFKWERGMIEHQRKGKCDFGQEKLDKGEINPLEEEIKCDFCDETRPRKDLLEQHISKEHKDELKQHGEKPKKFNCGKCGQEFYSWNSADQHIKRDTCHVKKKLDCRLCKVKEKSHQCMSEENLHKHLKKNHHREMMKFLEVIDSGAAKMIREKVKPALVCVKKKCNFSSDELYKWISHIQLHHQERFVRLLTEIFGDIYSEQPSSSEDE